MADAVTGFRAERAHLVRLGTSDGVGDRLDGFLAAFTRLAPDAPLELTHAPTATRLRPVRDGELDATFVRGDWPSGGLDLTPLWTDEVVVALPATHLLAERDVVDFADLAALPVRLSSPERNRTLHDLVPACCRAAGFEPVLGKEFTNAQHTLGTLGLGRPHWTVFYRAHANLLPVSGVGFRPLHNPAPVMPTRLATAADRRLRPEVLALIEAGRTPA
ncbi:LysR family substrate-binding domain-containing protein [Amycolatopsis sp. FDAARGOS 1241]|uniref:LysR family substrate-binding domain-containing protein n=1 Tax=Amycolatopsis sp. FDAARGOS 1241 TaxID=2778070 RepID=UPI00351C6A3E